MKHGLPARFAVRFALAYFTLYAIASPVFYNLAPLPSGDSLSPRSMARVVTWVASHTGLAPLVVESGSIDRTFDWLQLAMMLVMSTVAALAWLAVDRSRLSRPARPTSRPARPIGNDRLVEWLRVVLRYSLGAVLFGYGIVKVFPIQFAEPSLMRMLQPVGELPLPTLLITTIGASPVYEMCIGAFEVIAAMLLFLPRTWRLGAIAALISCSYVALLNLTYDITDKIFTLNLLLMAVLLAAPDVRRIVRLLAQNHAAVAALAPVPLFEDRGRHRLATGALGALAVYICVVTSWSALSEWRSEQSARSHPSPIQGAWRVVNTAIDGQPSQPLASDDGGWRYIVFDGAGAGILRMDNSLVPYVRTVDAAARSVSLTSRPDGGERLSFTFDRPDADHLVLDTSRNGRAVRIDLVRLDASSWPLMRPHFAWIQERRAAGQ